jgi:hypothetical protein
MRGALEVIVERELVRMRLKRHGRCFLSLGTYPSLEPGLAERLGGR